jgi:hypothetical protein
MIHRLMPAHDEYQRFDHVGNRRAQRFLRDMRMLGANSAVISELLRDLLYVVENPARQQARAMDNQSELLDLQ